MDITSVGFTETYAEGSVRINHMIKRAKTRVEETLEDIERDIWIMEAEEETNDIDILRED